MQDINRNQRKIEEIVQDTKIDKKIRIKEKLRDLKMNRMEQIVRNKEKYGRIM